MLTISETPLRRVVTRGSARVNGFFATHKNPRALVWESRNELDLLRLLELDPSVRAIFVQAVCMVLRVDGAVRKHYPDVAALTWKGWEIYEAKSDKDLDSPEVLELAGAAMQETDVQETASSDTYPEPLPVTYTLVFEHMLKQEPLASSARMIALHLHRHVPFEIELRTIDLVAQAGPLTVSDLADKARVFGGTAEYVYALVARGRLRMDLNRPLTRQNLIWTPDQYPFGSRVFDPHSSGGGNAQAQRR